MTSTNKHGRIRTATVEPFIKNEAVRKELNFLNQAPFLALCACFSLSEAVSNVNRFLELAYQVRIPRRREAWGWRRLNRNLFLRIPLPLCC